MYSAYELFVKTLKIGERTFSLSYSDYKDAYDYSQKYHAKLSDHMIDFFENHSTKKLDEYSYDLIRYVFMKAMEQRISSDLFTNTSRGNVCDVFHSPFDIALPFYPTNLPRHLENLLNHHQSEGHIIAQEITKEMQSNSNYIWGAGILNALQFIGQTIGYHVGQENKTYKRYHCSDMLTKNELNIIAGTNLCNWLTQNSYSILETNFTRDTYQNIIAKRDERMAFILISAEVAPTDPGFFKIDLDNLYNAAKEAGAMPYYASVSLGSLNEKHFTDGVVLFGDKVRYRINAFDRLELKS